MVHERHEEASELLAAFNSTSPCRGLKHFDSPPGSDDVQFDHVHGCVGHYMCFEMQDEECLSDLAAL